MLDRPKRALQWLISSLWAFFILSSEVALAAPVGQTAAENASLWTVLLPLLAATVAVERAVEIIWNYLEWLAMSVGRWQPAQLKTAQYMQFKSGTSLVLGIILGILVTNYTGMRFFEYIQPLVPNFIVGIPIAWDVLITGFVIGALAKPVHDILGIITQLKNLLGNSALRQREAAGAALAEGVLKLAQSDAQAMVDVPGIGPTRLQSGSARRGNGDGEESTVEEKSSTEKYVDLLHNRTMM